MCHASHPPFFVALAFLVSACAGSHSDGASPNDGASSGGEGEPGGAGTGDARGGEAGDAGVGESGAPGDGGSAGASPGIGGTSTGGDGATGGRPVVGVGGAGVGGSGGSSVGGSGGASVGGSGGASVGGSGGASVGGSAGEPPVGSGGAAGGGAVIEPSGLVGRAFDVRFPVSDVAYENCIGDCEPSTLLVTAATETTLDVVWGATGRAQKLTLSRAGDGWELEGTVQLGSEWTWEYALCADSSTLGPATFTFGAGDANGAGDLSIAGHLTNHRCSDDYTYDTELDLVITGVPDARLPRAIGPAAPIEPVHGLSLDVDKPLEASATCLLMPEGGGDAVELTPRQMEGYVVGCDTDVVLPLGSRYTTRIVGTDFAGIGATENIEVAVLDDFGVIDDGFESGTTDGVQGGAVVEAYGVPAIAGSYMVQVDPGTPLLLHLVGTGAEASLVFDARLIDGCGFSWLSPGPIEVAVVGSDSVVSVPLGIGETSESVTVNDRVLEIGEVQHLVVPLPAAGTDVLVYFRGDNYQGSGCMRTGLLLDDVHLE